MQAADMFHRWQLKYAKMLRKVKLIIKRTYADNIQYRNQTQTLKDTRPEAP